VFRVVEGGSQKVLLFCVPDWTRETLVHRLITTHIRPRTVIYSDQFTPYIPLNQLGYIHLSVNHSQNFVDPDSGAHTNTIEGVWALVKKMLKWMWYPVWIHTQLLGWVHLVPELRERLSIQAVARRHCWAVTTAVKLQLKTAPFGATTYYQSQWSIKSINFRIFLSKQKINNVSEFQHVGRLAN